MNKLILTGRFGKVWHEEGKSFIFKVSVRRSYKNKDTDKYDWDNITVTCPAFNKSTIKFLENYVNDGDIVTVEGHIYTYATEKDGSKIYHEDKVCDSISITARTSEKGAVISEERVQASPDYPEGFSEAGLDDDEMPF